MRYSNVVYRLVMRDGKPRRRKSRNGRLGLHGRFESATPFSRYVVAPRAADVLHVAVTGRASSRLI